MVSGQASILLLKVEVHLLRYGGVSLNSYGRVEEKSDLNK